ncbi:MAG: DUF2842 domain-containing protein [Hyphomicrobiaceae bacterium]|nr:DUF2842 domain-containing protein [Hyphomicrobiaceae bacterium]
MPVRLKKLIGLVVLVAWVFLYAFTVSLWADTHLYDVHKAVQIGFFLVAGVAWVLPVMLLIKWMYRAPKA